MPRIRLLATCQINGAVHHAGDVVFLPDGQRGPHRTVVSSSHGAQIAVSRYPGEDDADASYLRHQTLVDEPLYVVVNEGVEKDREELRARHAQERAKLDRDPERDALIAKQAKEESDFELHAAEVQTKERQEREDDALKQRQEAETAAFDKRAEITPTAPAPHETDKEALENRHKAEREAQEAKHAEEQRSLEARKERKQQTEDAPVEQPHDVPVEVATHHEDHVVVHEAELQPQDLAD